MLGANEINEVIHRTSNAEKLETDLITALSHIIGQSRRGGKWLEILSVAQSEQL